MKFEIKTIEKENIPLPLLEIPQSPKKLYFRGNFFYDEDYKYLTIIGSRKCTSYGKAVCEELIKGLQGYPIVIVSGLALGIDSIAHQSALKYDLRTIAFPGSGLADKVLYPRSNFSLAMNILESGGSLISEFEPNFKACEWGFPARNRLMAGISKAVLIIEAEERSGTLITSRLALDYNKDVLAVPGSIFSLNSKGTNNLLKQGAYLISSSDDIIDVLGLKPKEKNIFEKNTFKECSDEEKEILNFLTEPRSRDEIIRFLKKNVSQVNTLLTVLEIKNLIKEEAGLIYRLF